MTNLFGKVAEICFSDLEYSGWRQCQVLREFLQYPLCFPRNRKVSLFICLGAQSFEHANVLSEKINFSALGGPGVAIFGPDDLHPMY